MSADTSLRMPGGVSKQHHLYEGLGYSIALILYMPVLYKSIQSYKVYNTPSQKVLLAANVANALYAAAWGASCLYTWSFFEEETMPMVYSLLAISTLFLFYSALGLLTAVIIERIIVIRPSGERSRGMNYLQAINIGLRLIPYCLTVAGFVVLPYDDYVYVSISGAAVNSLFSIFLETWVNFRVARCVYQLFSVEDNRDRTKNGKYLAKPLYVLMITSALFEFITVILYLLSHFPSVPDILSMFPPIAIFAHFVSVVVYQDQIRKIYFNFHVEER